MCLANVIFNLIINSKFLNEKTWEIISMCSIQRYWMKQIKDGYIILHGNKISNKVIR